LNIFKKKKKKKNYKISFAIHPEPTTIDFSKGLFPSTTDKKLINIHFILMFLFLYYDLMLLPFQAAILLGKHQ